MDNELQSLALLIADMNAQIRALQQENQQLREALASQSDEERQREIEALRDEIEQLQASLRSRRPSI